MRRSGVSLDRDRALPSVKRSSNPCRGATPQDQNFPPSDFVDAIAHAGPICIPNIRGYLRFGPFLQLETAATGIRSQPCRCPVDRCRAPFQSAIAVPAGPSEPSGTTNSTPAMVVSQHERRTSAGPPAEPNLNDLRGPGTLLFLECRTLGYSSRCVYPLSTCLPAPVGWERGSLRSSMRDCGSTLSCP